MSFIREAFTGSDNKNKISAMRVSVLMTVGSIMATFVAHNVFAILSNKGLVSLGWNEVVILTTVLGAKAFQHTSESKNPTSAVTVTSSIGSGAASINPTQKDDADMAKE